MSIMCSYQDCLCVKYPCSSTAFFRLPTDNRRMTWIRNSGNKSLLNISEKAHRFFCENHFRHCDIRTQFNRKILRKQAVPIKHDSNIIAPEFSVASHQAAEFHHYNEEKKRKDTNFIIEKLDENSDDTQLTDCENFDEYKVHDTDDTTETLDDSYNLLNFSATDNFNELQDDCEDSTRPDILRETETAAYYDEEANANQADSSTIDISFACITEDKSYEINDEEFEMPMKKRKPNETELVRVESISASTRTLNVNDYQEDKHFALSLVGYFQRLPKDKKALAKLKILKYLTELDMGCPANL